MIRIGEITELSYDLKEAFKEIESLKVYRVLPLDSIQHWLHLFSCLIPDCAEFIKLYKIDYTCAHPVCICKVTCTCGKCTFCDVQKFQDLNKNFCTLIEYHSYLGTCKEAISHYNQYGLNDMELKYWKRKYSKLYDKLSLFHYHFDKDLICPVMMDLRVEYL